MVIMKKPHKYQIHICELLIKNNCKVNGFRIDFGRRYVKNAEGTEFTANESEAYIWDLSNKKICTSVFEKIWNQYNPDYPLWS